MDNVYGVPGLTTRSQRPLSFARQIGYPDRMDTPVEETAAARLQPDLRVSATYLVRRKVRGVGKTGKSWLQLILGDRSGTVDARVWDNADQVDREIQENDVVQVEGQTVRFMDQVQLKVFKLKRDPDANPEDYLPRGRYDAETLREAYAAEFAAITNPWVRRLLEAYLEDTEWWRRFVRAPAAKSVHHAYIGGLAEHTLSMLRLARMVGEHYRALGVAPLSVDTLVAGAFLHDSGKMEELDTDAGFEYTDAGRLLGHIVIAVERLGERLRAIEGFPAELALHLKHLILSHHGELEYGSPTRPMTLEAMILHFIDNLDARVEIFSAAIKNSAPGLGNWTGYEPAVSRYIYRKPLDGLGDDSKR